MTDELDKPIGTKEKPRLTAGSVVVARIEIKEMPTKKGGKVKIVNFHCKHPDRQELVEISNLKMKKVQGNNETITKDGIWYREDEDGSIDKGCNAALVMRYYNKTMLRQFEGSAVNTELDAGGYLTIKVY